MSQLVLDAIAEEIASLVRLVPTPTAPLGYGRDLSCTRDLTETLDEVDPFSIQAIQEAAIRRLKTRRGELPDGGLPEDLEYGWSVLSLLSRGLTPAEVRDAAGEIQSELTKDDRVASATVTLVQKSLKELSISIEIVPEDPNLGKFDFVLVATPDGLQEAA